MASLSIIGGGPAALSAAIYAARGNLSATVLYKDDGALGKTDKIENYFGFADVQSGRALLESGRAQAKRLGATLLQTEVIGIQWEEAGFSIETASGETYSADAVLLATGAPRAVPNIAGLREFEGRGISYCAICDAFFYRGKHAAVLGQGDYARSEALTLAPVAAQVTLLTNGAPAPSGLPENVIVDTRTVQSVSGGDTLSAVQFAQGDPLAVDGVFIAYGTAGSTDFARKLGAAIDGTRIRVDQNYATNVPGLFAAGDCIGGLFQVAKAVSDGAQAATQIIQYLRQKNKA